MFLMANATAITPRGAQTFLNSFALLIRSSKIQLKTLEMANGEEIAPTEVLLNDEYRIPYTIGTEDGNLRLYIKEDRYDIFDLVRSTNQMLKKQKSIYRLLLLAPNEDKWGMIFTQIAEANRAHKGKWGQLLL
jgi:hypothetical protein